MHEFRSIHLERLAKMLKALNESVIAGQPTEDFELDGILPDEIPLFFGWDKRQEQSFGKIILNDFDEYVFVPAESE